MAKGAMDDLYILPATTVKDPSEKENKMDQACILTPQLAKQIGAFLKTI